jgi:hypothetical protein
MFVGVFPQVDGAVWSVFIDLVAVAGGQLKLLDNSASLLGSILTI